LHLPTPDDLNPFRNRGEHHDGDTQTTHH
jgi:hypothetical protein